MTAGVIEALSTAPEETFVESNDSKSLDELAREIGEEHHKAEQCVTQSLEHARMAGLKLIAAKKKLEHGEFMPWVKTQCAFDHSTANLYMKIARDWATLELKANSERVRNLSLRQAAKLVYMSDEQAEEAVSPKDDAPPEEPSDWRSSLSTTQRHDSLNRLCKYVRAFTHALQGGQPYADMANVLYDRDTLTTFDINVIGDEFSECYREVAKYIEAVEKRREKLPVTWTKDHEGNPVKRFIELLPRFIDDTKGLKELADFAALTEEEYDLLRDMAGVALDKLTRLKGDLHSLWVESRKLGRSPAANEPDEIDPDIMAWVTEMTSNRDAPVVADERDSIELPKLEYASGPDGPYLVGSACDPSVKRQRRKRKAEEQAA
jgi:hypothetical protein